MASTSSMTAEWMTKETFQDYWCQRMSSDSKIDAGKIWEGYKDAGKMAKRQIEGREVELLIPSKECDAVSKSEQA